MKRKFLLAFIVILQILLIPGIPNQIWAAEEIVEIDLNKHLGPATQRGSGIINLLAGSKRKAPPRELVEDLHLNMIRLLDNRIRDLENLSTLGKYLSIHPEAKKYIKDGNCPGHNNQWDSWEEIAKTLVRKTKETGIVVVWEIWNEPNNSEFWPCSDEQFFELWKRTHKIIKTEDPDIKIVGPSTASFETSYLTKFFQFAKKNNVLPDVFSWHDLYPQGADVLPGHIEFVKNLYRGANLPIPPLEVNETMGEKIILKPGMAVQFFAVAEREKLFAMARTCGWPVVAECWNQTLGGLLTDPDKGQQPRSVYWAYREYGNMTGKIIQLLPSRFVDGVATLDDGKNILKILLGNHEKNTDAQVKIKNISRHKNLIDQSGKARVKIYLIPNTETQPLSKPVLKMDKIIKPDEGNISINLGELKIHEAALVTVCPVDDCENQTPTPTSTVKPTNTVILGDANNDGEVDGVDYVIWLNHYNQSTNQGPKEGDFNKDGEVDGLDYVIWVNNAE